MEKDLEMGWRLVLHQIMDVLNYKLFEVDGSGVSVGKLITGVALLVAGYFFSGRAAREFDRRVLSRLNLEESLRYTFQRLFFYFWFIVISLFILRALNVPITIFTVVGGAVAVGIGFGSQNIINNFISGVLVMVGRPIRVGDFIDIDGVAGTVINIGIRSTTVLTPASAAVIIPNTSLIEKNLINWSYSQTVYDSVRIGVAYGTDVPLLNRVCLSVLAEVDGISAPKEANVIFHDFGDSALVFDLIYTIPSSRYPVRRRIQSDVRSRLNQAFLEHGISVPFPQREVRILGEKAPENRVL